MDFPRRLGEALRRLRLNLKKSQGGVAEAAGVSQGTLSRIERGLMPITVESLVRLSAALEVRPWAVLAYADFLEPTQFPDQLETIASVLAWAEYDPVAWRQTSEVLRAARGPGRALGRRQDVADACQRADNAVRWRAYVNKRRSASTRDARRSAASCR